MKNAFCDLTVDQILELTPEQTQQYIVQEWMDQGIPIVNEIPVKPSTEVLPKDKTIHSLGSWYFNSREEAEEVRKLILKYGAKKSRSWSKSDYESDYEALDMNSSDVRIEEISIWSKDLKDRVGDALKEAKQAEEAYKRAKSEYEEIEERRRTARNEINETIWHFDTINQKMKALHANFGAYLEAAGGDKEAAWKFFSMAYKDQIAKLEDDSDWAYERKSEKYFVNKLKDLCYPEPIIACVEEEA